MKIGILTFHRAHNYGAVLQCYALQEVLKGMGHEVEVIDYRQPNIERGYNHFRIKEIISAFIKIWKLNVFLKKIWKEKFDRKLYSSFRNKYLNINNKCQSFNVPTDYDAYVIGSDQLFTIDITKTLDIVYSGQFKRNKESRIIGYAISMNLKSIEQIGINGWHEISQRFDAFSTREEVLSDEIFNLSGIRFKSCIDPTLLTNADIWQKISSHKTCTDKFIVVYEVRKVNYNPKLICDKAQIIANKYGYSVINLSDNKYAVTDWIWYISNARCVFTTSFHATVFSLLFHQPLYAFCLNDGGDDRYVDILRKVGASTCILDLDECPDVIPKMDWGTINDKLQFIKTNSMEFLESNLDSNNIRRIR